MTHPYRDLILELRLPQHRCFKCDPTYDELVELCRRAHDALVAMDPDEAQTIEEEEFRELFHGRRNELKRRAPVDPPSEEPPIDSSSFQGWTTPVRRARAIRDDEYDGECAELVGGQRKRGEHISAQSHVAHDNASKPIELH
jgi:hypothetical protein